MRRWVCRNGPIGGARVEGGVDWEVSQGGGALTVGIFGAGGMGEGEGGWPRLEIKYVVIGVGTSGCR